MCDPKDVSRYREGGGILCELLSGALGIILVTEKFTETIPSIGLILGHAGNFALESLIYWIILLQ